jgi:hypothetical protein
VGWLLLAQGRHGGTHRRPGSQTIVHQDDRAPSYVKGRSASAIVLRAPLQLLLFLGRHGFDDVLREAQEAHDFGIQDAHTTGGNGPHGQFFVAWHPQLAYQKDIEGDIKRLRHFKGHRDATAWQCQHHDVWAVGVSHELLSQRLTRLGTIPEPSRLLGKVFRMDHGLFSLLSSGCRYC